MNMTLFICISNPLDCFLSDLVELLNRAQCSRADDQRGLLTKDQLEIPQFLQMEAQNEKQTSCDQTQEEDCFL